MSLAYRSLVDAGRVPGGTLVFGETHHPSDTERVQVREFLRFLASRAVLVSGSLHRHPSRAVESATRMRDRLYELLSEMAPDALAVPSLRMIRAACEKVLLYGNGTIREGKRGFLARGPKHSPHLLIAVGNLRGVCGTQIAILCVMYGIDLEGTIAEILPRG